ncbi:helix-turn-helix transcriptional regulator [Clostridium botulinum]|uniref:helix-turn-helix domain-containing protein n=1 Tax=Clostridium sp. ZBS12 TaxID=2949972 RepID=UPI000507DE80|nr:helix-turn-helix transcriptional regulator [Clostridium sp. ZBS12]KFX56190.1 transcriptional regulator [Clostridium botulinum]MBY6804403.1 helix-turn-helix transcriptional regulator [Clostridium botulinum]MBY6813366.1 helix-turn-helix transcriptional regulator [Clostridium botulinum]MBY6821900.1 helix-turn-helix transcriptional regulator [Clostridium botulinum]NFJ49971.1 helix-turn-helix transcriptional regulator [Clostridium botulinum]
MIKMRLHILLAEKRITRKQLSEDTGIRLATVSAYCNEKYKYLVPEHLSKLCKYLKCDISNLIEYVEDEE